MSNYKSRYCSFLYSVTSSDVPNSCFPCCDVFCEFVCFLDEKCVVCEIRYAVYFHEFWMIVVVSVLYLDFVPCMYSTVVAHVPVCLYLSIYVCLFACVYACLCDSGAA